MICIEAALAVQSVHLHHRRPIRNKVMDLIYKHIPYIHPSRFLLFVYSSEIKMKYDSLNIWK